MSIRALPPPPAIDADAPAAKADAPTESAAADPMIELLREDSADEGLNSWASSAASRVLARLREAHGTLAEEKRSGIFTAKIG
ncbi:MAG: hypothetical protein U0326_28560 [Polyangiales bacterium]